MHGGVMMTGRGGNRPGQALIGLSLTYEVFCKPESGIWPFIDIFYWPGLAYLKVCPDLEAYLRTYFILKSLNIQFCLLFNMPNWP